MSKNICKICGEKGKIQINRNDFFLWKLHLCKESRLEIKTKK